MSRAKVELIISLTITGEWSDAIKRFFSYHLNLSRKAYFNGEQANPLSSLPAYNRQQ